MTDRILRLNGEVATLMDSIPGNESYAHFCPKRKWTFALALLIAVLFDHFPMRLSYLETLKDM